MFKAAYNTDFYRAVRDALHAEVDSWHKPEQSPETIAKLNSLWRRVDGLEPISRDSDASTISDTFFALNSPTFIPVEELSLSGKA